MNILNSVIPSTLFTMKTKKDLSATNVIGALRVYLPFPSCYQAHQLKFQVRIQQIPGNMSPTGCRHGQLDSPMEKCNYDSHSLYMYSQLAQSLRKFPRLYRTVGLVDWKNLPDRSQFHQTDTIWEKTTKKEKF